MNRPRYTLGQLMAVIATLACLLALPRGSRSPILPAAYLFAGVTAFVLCNVVVESVFGIPCPKCSRWTLRRLARYGHYYRCSACRWRGKRTGLGMGPWVDATGPEDAKRYRQQSEARPWEGFAVPEELDGTSSGHLLRGKRSRAGRGSSPPPPDPGPRQEEAERRVARVLRGLRDLRGGRPSRDGVGGPRHHPIVLDKRVLRRVVGGPGEPPALGGFVDGTGAGRRDRRACVRPRS